MIPTPPQRDLRSLLASLKNQKRPGHVTPPSKPRPSSKSYSSSRWISSRFGYCYYDIEVKLTKEYKVIWHTPGPISKVGARRSTPHPKVVARRSTPHPKARVQAPDQPQEDKAARIFEEEDEDEDEVDARLSKKRKIVRHYDMPSSEADALEVHQTLVPLSPIAEADEEG
ncbi:hypothetical protein BT96DRAFT_1027523 [Gymnopus androsaceus JB14]|uniref:Uncharacterized protein n=1 Tax=Gymnopus androsaceus JB14 TaxID=1447944 RepID=A0A6A4GB85_9AGAR|nr:hypothetical protein BT96DRAFT_1027523 [Gymnopus androsaceus JB14]